MLSVEDALAAILQHVTFSSTELLELPSTLYRVLAEDLATPHASPPFDKSMMDGFAVTSADSRGDQSVTLQVLETITAGTVPSQTVGCGNAARIMTGAPMPAGADCVVPIERVHFDEDHPQTVTVSSADLLPERHVLRSGSLATAGEPLLRAGTVLEPQHIAVLAEFGVARVPVFRRPSVAVLATGDELLPFDQPLTAGHIRNSNEPMLVSQIQRAHATPVPLGVAADNREDLRRHIQQGLRSDFLLLSGGVSAGTLDLVPSELQAAGVCEVFHKIAMKPGKPLWFGQRRTDDHCCWVFGLPGNPVSSMLCFELFARTALRKFTGVPNPLPQTVSATLIESISIRGDRVTYFPSRLAAGENGFEVRPVKWGGSADLRATAQANAMTVLEPRDEPHAAGDIVPVISWT